jgi:TPR repeat protein
MKSPVIRVLVSFLIGAGVSYATTLYVPVRLDMRLRDEITPAINMIKGGHLSDAVQILEPLALRGNPFAQRELGIMLAMGVGVGVDTQRAVELFRKAECRCEPGGGELAVAFEFKNGDLADQDIEAYRAWLERSAAAGSARARELLLDMGSP